MSAVLPTLRNGHFPVRFMIFLSLFLSACGSGSRSDLTNDGSTLMLGAGNSVTIQGRPAAKVTAGSAYVFQPHATSSIGAPIVYSISSKPAWANFDTTSGSLSGIPSANQVGDYTGIIISAADGHSKASLPSFAVKVATVNEAPAISGTPPSIVRMESPYFFTPTASDSDDDSLTFIISNKPSWANFDPGTGQLTGTPSASDLGAYANILISVSDGTATAALPPFTIIVEPAPTGQVTLAWTPPTQNSDGTALNDLAGYIIYYGSNSTTLDQQVRLSDPSLTSHELTGLSAGTWYFAIKSLSNTGSESSFSNIASKTLP